MMSSMMPTFPIVKCSDLAQIKGIEQTYITFVSIQTIIEEMNYFF
jgi:hypothetical protein